MTMGELISKQAWTTEMVESSSRYARMIPGVSTASSSRSRSKPMVSSRRSSSTSAQPTVFHGKSLTTILLPHPVADPWTLYQSVIADLLVLGVVGTVQARFVPGWGFREFTLPLFAVVFTLFAFSEGVYRGTADPLPRERIAAIARSGLFATLLVYLAEWGRARFGAVLTSFAISVGSLVVYRKVVQLAWARRRQKECKRTLLIGAGPVARAIARTLRNDPLQRAVVCGFVADDLPQSPDALGQLSDLDWLARSEFIDEVILALPGQPAKTREAAQVALRNHLDIRAVPDLPPGPWPDATIDYIGEVPIVTLHRESVPAVALSLKRIVDFFGAAAGLVLAAPVMATVAALIKLDSRGPILYAAERTGVKGRRFHCYKFRSMVADADDLKEKLRSRNQRQGPIFKITDDPRITRVGRLIRRYSLDELPQLWNVLCGDMSLVGPRPHPVDEVNHYELHHYRRLDVKPGITGLWQITARHSPSFDLNMHLDLTYIEHWSLRLDFQILLSTIRVLFAPEGA
jgi:exopolysaccharide biosynthesis polyprenyl glycosylphosphotransferase